jgi:hypothetical protein
LDNELENELSENELLGYERGMSGE